MPLYAVELTIRATIHLSAVDIEAATEVAADFAQGQVATWIPKDGLPDVRVEILREIVDTSNNVSSSPRSADSQHASGTVAPKNAPTQTIEVIGVGRVAARVANDF